MLDSRREVSPQAVPILAIHLAALLALLPPFFSWSGVALMVVTGFFFGQGICLGYHRLLAHRSFKVPLWLERFYVLVALCCLQESPAKWVSTHRLHHACAEGEHDPHSPRASFWWSHMGWLLNSEGQIKVHERYARDLLNDPFYRFLERAWWSGPALFVAQMLVFFKLGGWSWMLWGVVARVVFVWHATWSVNSLAHLFGYRNYSSDEDSRNNWFVALITSGEGWHNNHHREPGSASTQHRWWELDVTFYHILLLEKLGLASEVIRPSVKHQMADRQ